MYSSEVYRKLKGNIGKVIVGKDEVIDNVIICLLCGGHLLLEDMPGTGKTTLAKSLARSAGCDFKRIQFTPDLLPSEVTGLKFFDQKEGDFVFSRGMIFTDFLLADEINRATPRTQSSLLECMEERQVSVSGVTYPLGRPFMVMATQNPVETQGTFPLPEAQLDRFLMKLSMGYPSFENEIAMLMSRESTDPLDMISEVISKEDIVKAQDEIKGIHVNKDISAYVISIVTATRQDPDIKLGVSPRGALALLNAARGHAAVRGRDYVLPDDVKAMAEDVLAHRIILRKLTSDRTESSRTAVRNILSRVSVPAEQG